MVIIGRKAEMTQYCNSNGECVPVTVVEMLDNYIVAKREENGYKFYWVGVGINKKAGIQLEEMYKKAKFVPSHTKSFKTDDLSKFNVGDQVKWEEFIKEGNKIVVEGFGKGKGFTGVVKRWGFAGGPRTHGQSDRERAPGSIGAGTDPGRVLKGKKMAGRMGGKKVTVKDVEVVKIVDNFVLLCGPVPGGKKSYVYLWI